ncbi:MAG: prevent-host-death protein [Gammaproteobacteria bacterium]|nr:prevent-host-death protein [Gammaproteobacteria bacterium]MBU1447905.1 prevent-host-death protein [Gammaproteobacteria bacterium]
MKTATMPALRVQPELRQAAEEILRPGETLSAFVEDSLRRNVEFRRTQQAFIARGLASRDAAKTSGVYVSSEEVLLELDDMLAKAKKKAGK